MQIIHFKPCVMKLVNTIKNNATLKKIVLWMLQPPMRPRPRLWIRILVNPFFHKKGKNALIRFQTRMDVFPFNTFHLGKWSTIENFSCVNNAMGAVVIGDHSRIGLSNTIIGPVQIGDNVNMAQNVVISGLNHGYEEISIAPRLQKCSTSQITIENDCWIGANVVITSGVTIGQHCVIAAGSVVTKSSPPYCILAGNPAKIIKYYDFGLSKWMKYTEETDLNFMHYGKAI